MEIKIYQNNGISIAEIISDDVLISNVDDALDVIANCGYQGASKIIINESNLPSTFFDLKTKIAGDILQKFSNYNSYLAIVGDFTKYESKSLKDFIYESNKQGRIIFVSTTDEARTKFSTKQ